MEAAGFKTDYVEHMVGHRRDTLHDVESLGIEKPRSIYANANISTRTGTVVAKLDLIREFARGVGVDPEKVQLEPDARSLDP